uniref:Mu-hexatoxin-Mg2a n=1 Tax=Macrothele gigas TaxID=223896 RepID=TX22A_MACGS|nr:RecName: Full=Mu-hexatoxin-Mg2a; Short=Mu-HXTX-Mg2a; AltName: Full=Neurotoxin magi-3 [Macrothele gigas]6AX2_A Chain A, Mu-hexatoxin-Mg2a [Macrothele gigas]
GGCIKWNHSCQTTTLKCCGKCVVCYCHTPWGTNCRCDRTRLFCTED